MAGRTGPTDRTIYVISTFNIGEEGFNGVRSIKTDIFYSMGRLSFAATLIKRNGRGITPGPDQHFKTNHRLAYPSCPNMDPWIHRSTVQVHWYQLLKCGKFTVGTRN